MMLLCHDSSRERGSVDVHDEGLLYLSCTRGSAAVKSDISGVRDKPLFLIAWIHSLLPGNPPATGRVGHVCCLLAARTHHVRLHPLKPLWPVRRCSS